MGYKQARRREDDIAIVNAGLRVHLEQERDEWKVKDSSLCFGGMSYITKFASQTQQFLCGRYLVFIECSVLRSTFCISLHTNDVCH